MKVYKQPIHICNYSQPIEEQFLSIYSISELKNLNLSEAPFILINIFLLWEGRDISSDYGITIGQELRTKFKYKNPIIFYSPFSNNYYLEKSKAKLNYKLLYGRGSGFIQIPTTSEDIHLKAEKIIPLSNATLIDVSTMLCDLKGMVLDRLNHNLKPTNNIVEVIEEITPYLTKEQVVKIRVVFFGEELTKCINVNDIDSFFKVKKEFINLCSLWLGVNEEVVAIPASLKPEILIVDDEKDVLMKVEENLSPYFNVHKTLSGEEAIEILNSDLENNIKAVIADWRLYEPSSTTVWQSCQGYEILEVASRTGFRALFSLTSQPEYIVNQIRNSLGIDFSLFKKDEVIYNDNWSILASLLNEGIEFQNRLISSIPKKTHWYKNSRKGEKGLVIAYESLHSQYLKHLNSSNREVYRKEIDIKCDEIWAYLLEFEKNAFKGTEDLKQRFGLSLPKDPELYSTLILRRIWIALWYYYFDEKLVMSPDDLVTIKEDIFEIMSSESKATKTNINAQVSQLCIDVSQLRSFKILPEEKIWLLTVEHLSLDNFK